MKTEIHECPKCNEPRCFNVFKTPLEETKAKWFMCSFCGKSSDKASWLKKPPHRPTA